MQFRDLGLSDKALGALERAGFEAPTPVQAQAIPPALQGKDVIGSAATGTGKTLAFALPILERLEGKHGTRALILAPTRELALQIGAELERFGHGRHVRSAVVIGGVGMNPQIQAFQRGVEVIVATPGRLNDHLDQGTARLDQIEILVLDEADRMLDMGFLPQLRRILKHVPKKRQSLLFSATMAGEVQEFAREHLQHPVRVEVARSGTTSERAEQQVFLVGEEEKVALLLALLQQDELSTLVFTRTKRRADRVAKALARGGHQVAVIHADRSQAQRRHALEGFRGGKRRAASTWPTSATSSISICRTCPRTTSIASAAPRARRPAAAPPASPRQRSTTCSVGSRSSRAKRWNGRRSHGSTRRSAAR